MVSAAVLVVGAGPTGLLLTAELARRGVSCLLVDAHDRPLDWDRATVVHPRTLEIFEALGIVGPLLAAGVRQRKARLHASGGVLGEIDLALCGSRYPFNIGVSEEVTEAILAEHLARQGGSVVRATTLVDLDERAEGVHATLEHAGTRRTIVAQWVVGCDGHHSTVRRLAGIEQEGHDIAEPWAVFDAAVAGWPDSFEANYAYLDETPVILTALPDRRWRVYLRPSGATSDLVADATATLGRYLPDVAFEDVAHPTRFHCHTKVARAFRAGRLILAGDAAHTCSPAQGHGMNSGLQDAYNLAWKLALVAQGQSAPGLLDSYEAERRPVAQLITAEGDAAESVQMVKTPAERRARDAAIRSAFADPGTRHHEAVAEAELDIDYAASPVVMGTRGAALWPGQRLPDCIALRYAGGGEGSLHACAHRIGHTALVVAGPAAAAGRLAEVMRALEPMIAGGSQGIGPVGGLVETAVAIAADPADAAAHAYLAAADAAGLGIADVTLVVVRADGHVGLRADTGHAEALAAYVGLIRAGGAGT